MMSLYASEAPGGKRHRGGVLLEVLVALGLFIGAGAFALGASHQALDMLDRSRRSLMALDLCRSKLAELEAGLISLEELRTGRIDEVGTMEIDGGDRGSPESIIWDFEIKTQRTEFRGLTLVELTVTEQSKVSGQGGASTAVSATLRQLMSLRDLENEQYEVDDLLRGLPEERTDRGGIGGGPRRHNSAREDP